MKKIGLYLGIGPASGGVFSYCQSVLDALAALPKDEFSVVVIYTDPSLKDCLALYEFNCAYLRKGWFGLFLGRIWDIAGLPVKTWQKLSAVCYNLVRRLAQEKCDLWVFPAQDALSYKAPVPALSTIHDLMHRYEPSFPEVSAGGEFRRRERLLSKICQWSKAILVDSETGKQHVHESYGIPNERIFSLPYVPPKYVFADKASPDFDAKYRLPPKYIFYPAQFWRHKNHLNLVSAIAEIINDCPDIHLVLVGGKRNGYSEIVTLVNSLNLQEHILFAGFIPENDLPEFYRRARGLVMPTYFGPTNIPQLEAFALGCPVATSNIYGIPDQVGDAALLFDPHSVDEIAACIKRLWTDDILCKQLIEKGRRKAASWTSFQFNQRFESIVRHVLTMQQEMTRNSSIL